MAYCIFYVAAGYFEYSLKGMTCYCSGSLVGVGKQIHFYLTFFMLSMDILNVVIAFTLIRFNRVKIRENRSTAPLVVKFRYRQTLRSIEQTLPVAIVHLAFFSIQYILFEIDFGKLSTVEYVAVMGFCYITPYYCVLCAAVFLVLMIREETAKKKELERIHTTTVEGNGEVTSSV
ncbi:hypothetical protein PMAYCL1PPCAC_10314 [Pristionchus mayeri]|uniref:G protein-coupled receptor n=1 Tax=Pristionchus mayeri TaxID=1317129 RepID=A0AAN4ZHS1_9BILA|nr:hypothetical protein PMAYCL1PPCAC_10314 [Pristionchus mayeri]